MTEKLSNNEIKESPRTAWDDLGSDQSFEDNVKKAERDRKADKVLQREQYVKNQKDSEAFGLGLKSCENSEKLNDLKQKIETSYRLGNIEGAEAQLENQAKLESEEIEPAGEKLMQTGGEATREQVTDVLAHSGYEAREFAKETVTADEAAGLFSKEQAHFNRLMKKYERWNSPDYTEPKGFFEKRSHNKIVKETMDELARLGFDPANRKTSKEAELYGGSFVSGTDKLGLGLDRAESFKTIDNLSKGKYGRKVQKELKKHGFKEMPRNWMDESFTTHEIGLMSQIAESAINTLKYKER